MSLALVRDESQREYCWKHGILSPERSVPQDPGSMADLYAALYLCETTIAYVTAVSQESRAFCVENFVKHYEKLKAAALDDLQFWQEQILLYFAAHPNLSYKLTAQAEAAFLMLKAAADYDEVR